MTEEELLQGLLDGLAVFGWRAWHVRRSDRALWQGVPGWPDITALPPRRLAGPLLVIEAKAAKGVLSYDQAAWLARLIEAGVTAAVVRPAGYDRALELVAAGDPSPTAWAWAR